MRISALVAVAVVAIVAGLLVVAESTSGSRGAPAEQRGLVLPTWEQHGYASTDTPGAMHAIASVGADWVQLTPTWYQPTNSAIDIGPTEESVADDDLRQAIAAAHAAGLKVQLKPHVDVVGSDDRALIDPADRNAWFGSYQAFITHYADLAGQLAADQLVVGTELGALSGDRGRWLTVIDEVRKHYHGPLVYAANHSEYPTVAFWDAVDLIGIDGYWSLSPQPTTDVSQLAGALAPIRDDLVALSARVGRRVLFTEVGYPSQVGGVTSPWDDHQSGQPAPDEQAAAYQAVLQTFSGQPWWAGVFWWDWDVAHLHDVDTAPALDYSIRGKPAESVLRRWWRAAQSSRSSAQATSPIRRWSG
jgi:hypothetical protein